MNTDDYVRAIEHSIHDIQHKVDKIDARLYKQEMKQKEDDSIKSFVSRNWGNIVTIVSLWADLFYTYHIWVPKH